MHKNMIEALPPQLQTSLQRWYIFSCCLVALTLLTMALIHGITLATTPTLPAAAHEVPLPAQNNHSAQQQDEMSQLRAGQQLFFSALTNYLKCIPEEIQLTHLVIDCHQQITAEGHARSRNDALNFLDILHVHGFGELTNLDIQQASDGCTFKLTVFYANDQQSFTN